MTKLVLVGLFLLLAGSARAQQQQDSAAAVRHIRAALADWVEAANREDWKAAARVWAPDLVGEVMVSGGMAVVRDIWRFTTAPDTPDSTVSVVRSYEVWKRQRDGQWRIARWISAPEPSVNP